MTDGTGAGSRVGRVVPRVVLVASIAVLALLAALSILNSFAANLSPDIALYLLHARTFVRTLDRFTLSHDSKGPLLAFFLAGPVRLFGANMCAAALAQLVAYAVAFACFYRLLRTYMRPAGAWVLSLLGICTTFSHCLWGGNARPEDFALAGLMVAFLGAWRRTRGWLVAGGVAAVCCGFMKSSLALTPLAVLAVGSVWPWPDGGDDGAPGGEERLQWGRAGRNLLWVGLGCAVAAALVLGWLAVFDSLPGWYRQTLEWPVEYRGSPSAALLPLQVRHALALVRLARLDYLFAAAVPGLAVGWLRGRHRLSALTCVFLVTELFRVFFEGANWNYTLTWAVFPLLIGAGLLGSGMREQPSSKHLAWMVPVYCLIPLLVVTAAAEARAFEYRLVRRLPSSYEYLAAGMREVGYRQGESVHPAGFDYQMILLLDAPRPPPVVWRHFNKVSQAEQAVTLREYEEAPPTWVIKETWRPASPPARLLGDVNEAYHLLWPGDSVSLGRERIGHGEVRRGQDLSPMLPGRVVYEKVLDIGCLQAWRLVDTDRPAPGRL